MRKSPFFLCLFLSTRAHTCCIWSGRDVFNHTTLLPFDSRAIDAPPLTLYNQWSCITEVERQNSKNSPANKFKAFHFCFCNCLVMLPLCKWQRTSFKSLKLSKSTLVWCFPITQEKKRKTRVWEQSGVCSQVQILKKKSSRSRVVTI